MSAKRSSFGMHHVTVVPTNFTPSESEDAPEDEEAPLQDDGTASRDETTVSRDQ